MGRAPCCDKANVKRGPWSPEEDAALKNYIHRHGSTGGSWIALPHKAGLKRCGKSCRLRWLNYLRPDIKHGSFTEEEDHIICSLYNSIGSRWSFIASQLPGRTDNDVKNYWNTKLKKKLLIEKTSLNNNNTNNNIKFSNCSVSSSQEEVSSVLGSSYLALDNNYDDGILMEFGFVPPYCDLLHASGSHEISSEVALSPNSLANFPYSSNLLANSSDSNPQGLFQSVTN